MSVATTKLQFDSERLRSGMEAYARPRGPYTVENASILLEKELLELYNEWLVWNRLDSLEDCDFAVNFQ